MARGCHRAVARLSRSRQRTPVDGRDTILASGSRCAVVTSSALGDGAAHAVAYGAWTLFSTESIADGQTVGNPTSACASWPHPWMTLSPSARRAATLSGDELLTHGAAAQRRTNAGPAMLDVGGGPPMRGAPRVRRARARSRPEPGHRPPRLLAHRS